VGRRWRIALAAGACRRANTPRVFYAMAPLLENQFDMMKGGRGCWGVKQSLCAAYAG